MEVSRYGDRWEGPGELGVEWEDPRDIESIELECDPCHRTLSKHDLRIQYWQKYWPQYGIPKGKKMGAGSQGWMPIDDWYNGDWKNAAFELLSSDQHYIINFRPLSDEFPELDGNEVKYRRTLKLRVLFPPDTMGINQLKTYTDSTWEKMDITVKLDGTTTPGQAWDGSLEVFNGMLESVSSLQGQEEEGPQGQNPSELVGQNGARGLGATVWYACNDDPNSFDQTIVTFRSSSCSFSFRMNDLEREGCIFIRAYGALVCPAEISVGLEDVERRIANSQILSNFDRIERMPEQSLDRAWKELPTKRDGIHLILGCKGRRQKFGLSARGDVFCPKLWNLTVKGTSSDRFLWDGETISYGFGFPDMEPKERFLEKGFMPVVHAKWIDDGIVYEQEAFATLLFKDPMAELQNEDLVEGDDPIVLMMKVKLTSTSLKRKRTSLRLTSTCKKRWGDRAGAHERLQLRDDLVYAIDGGARLRYCINRNDTISIGMGSSPEEVLCSVELDPEDSCTVFVKIPFITLEQDHEIERLRALDHERAKQKIIDYWSALLGRGTQINVPEEWLNDQYRAHLAHVHITDDKVPGSNLYACRVSSCAYGVYANESSMVISELDSRNLPDEAERRIEVFLKHQGSRVMPGNYSSKAGVFYGAGGYECGPYGQHHGWVLWCLAEHYRYTRDRRWLQRVAPNLVEGCEWVAAERRSTMKVNEKGDRLLEYGLLPAGSLEDVTDFWYWMVNNAHAYRGLLSVAQVLGEIGHPEAQRLLAESEAYRRDLSSALKEALVRNPVVMLRDGTWVPHFPSRVHRRGRDIGWIRESLEGAMHLILCGLVEPSSREAEWIMKDYEDNIYLSDQYGYQVSDYERHWFSRGGFSMQPNLYGFQIPYLWMERVKHFLRAFFNSFAVAFHPEGRLLTEHPLPTMADWSGDHYKTSDEAISCHCLRLMLAREKGQELHLLSAVPRSWLEDGKRISVTNMATHFGTLSFNVESSVSRGTIRMSIAPPVRNAPDTIFIRFRHPCGMRLRRVLIDGRDWDQYNPEEGIVLISHAKKPQTIEAFY